ncbi:S-layer homology domain-containing protein [Sporosarcina sp. ACRSM]|uniref:S-layer homology domain-containing protein n=1 Tax=Sporosarcina sp. ACRSM TaxID=2918216 RepID=UPI001EF6C484|nr:S-layer homology domain-containing protein [Sporosarcina sp. ACRSM]MCG7336527.1 S-layer homology domain-containing protein [Sporosarcina sp. ACRSM]
MTQRSASKSKKFIVGAASAALVASAVAPVASAKEFKDTKGNTHEKAVDALSDMGIISGYPDGTFQPNKTLTRSDVVKLMGKWLVAEGYDIPKDYKANPRFTDLTSSSNDELLQSAAIVKDNGLFNGNNGRLLASDNITRENMAVVLVRAFDKKNSTDLVSYVGEQDFKRDVIDLTKAKAEARPAIDVLDYFDITNPAAPAFNPKNTTTRGQFATFLYKTMNTDFSQVSDDQAAVDSAADLVKTGNVVVPKGEQATDKTKLEAVQAYVDRVVTGKGTKAEVVAGANAGEYKVILTKGEATAEQTMTVTFEYAGDDRFVTSVKPINATQFEVHFSTAVDADSVLTSSGTIKENTVAISSLDGVTAKVVSGSLSSNGKVLTVTANAPLSKRYDVKVKNVKTTNGKAIDDFTDMVTIAADTTAPTIKSVENLSATQVRVKFSEPMKAFNETTFKYEDGSAVSGITGAMTEGADEIVFTMDANVSESKRIVATFIGAQDMAKNLLTPNPATVTFQKGAADGIAPVVETIKQTGASSLSIKFSERLNDNPTVAVSGYPKTAVSRSTDDPTVYDVNVEGLLDGARTVTVSAFSDLSGEVGATTNKVITFTKDTTAPKVVSRAVVQDKANGKEYLELTFDKNINLGKNPTVSGVGSYVRNYVTVGSKDFDATPVTYKETGNKKVVRVELDAFLGENDFKAADYTLDLTFNNVTSESGIVTGTNPVTFTRGEDATPANEAVVGVTEVVQDPADNNKVNVTFNRAVDGATATTLANYSIDGAVIESVTLKPPVTSESGTTQVAVLNLKKGSNTYTGVRNIAIENIKAFGSTKTMDRFFTNTVSLKENVAPFVESAVLAGMDKVKLTFSEAVTTIGGEQDFELLIDGATVAGNKQVTTPAGSSIKSVELTLENEVTKANIASGLSLEVLDSRNIKDAAGNNLSIPANIRITQ